MFYKDSNEYFINDAQLIQISSECAGQRIDNYLKKSLNGIPKSKIYSMLRKGKIRVNKLRKKAHYRLILNDIIRLPPVFKKTKCKKIISKNILKQFDKTICYEDNDIIVLNKPINIAVHGGSGINYGIIDIVRHLRPEIPYLELVHRLDKETSGLLMIAKNRNMLIYLNEAMRKVIVNKLYNVLVSGYWSETINEVNAPLLKKYFDYKKHLVEVNVIGKYALTKFNVIRHFYNFATLIEAIPITGRTHQIRVHTKHVGHYIAGDFKYGDKTFSSKIRKLGGNRLFLHAKQLTIPLKNGNMLKIEAPMDTIWYTLFENIKKKYSF